MDSVFTAEVDESAANVCADAGAGCWRVAASRVINI